MSFLKDKSKDSYWKLEGTKNVVFFFPSLFIPVVMLFYLAALEVGWELVRLSPTQSLSLFLSKFSGFSLKLLSQFAVCP